MKCNVIYMAKLKHVKCHFKVQSDRELRVLTRLRMQLYQCCRKEVVQCQREHHVGPNPRGSGHAPLEEAIEPTFPPRLSPEQKRREQSFHDQNHHLLSRQAI